MIPGVIAAKAATLIPRALAGDPTALAVLAAVGVVVAVEKITGK